MYTEKMYEHTTAAHNVTAEVSGGFGVMRILQLLISSVGIIANFTVVYAFLNHKQLRGKIPNRFMVNQVGSNAGEFKTCTVSRSLKLVILKTVWTKDLLIMPLLEMIGNLTAWTLDCLTSVVNFNNLCLREAPILTPFAMVAIFFQFLIVFY